MKFIDTHQDPWHLAVTHRLLTVAEWQTERHTEGPLAFPSGQEGHLGLALANDDDLRALQGALAGVSLITLHFPKWTDGRAYSQARWLRSRLHYRGPLRATGDVRVDMLPLLLRTGFDEAELAEGESLTTAERVLQLQPPTYQGDLHEPRPQFARVTPALERSWIPQAA